MAPLAFAAPSAGVARAVHVQPPVQAREAPAAAALAMGSEADGAGLGLGSHALLGSLSTALALKTMRRRSRSQWRLGRRADSANTVMIKSPAETYEAMLDKGIGNSNMSVLKTLHNSIFGGFYVGMAGLLSLAIAGNLGPLTEVSMSAQRFTFAALFPVNLLLVLQTGAQLFTGNTATLSIAFYEGKANLRQVAKSWIFSWIGNVIGCGTMALMANYTHLLTAGTAELAVATVIKKTSSAFLPTMVKAIMCNWLVCMAVFLCSQANDLTGKMVGIWFPISMFVAIGFEHSVANMFLMPAGLMSGAPLTVADVFIKNLIPVSLGNAIAGSIVIGLGFAFSLGKLGQGDRGSFRGWLRILTGKSES